MADEASLARQLLTRAVLTGSQQAADGTDPQPPGVGTPVVVDRTLDLSKLPLTEHILCASDVVEGTIFPIHF